MQEASAIMVQNMKSTRRGQKNYNLRAWSSTVLPVDHVLLRNLTPRAGPGKVHGYWKDVIYVVRERKGPNCPLYAIETLKETERRRVLHRNLLIPCPYLAEKLEVCGKRKTVETNRWIKRIQTKPGIHQTVPAEMCVVC